jgi:hypothetical protein
MGSANEEKIIFIDIDPANMRNVNDLEEQNVLRLGLENDFYEG